MGVSDFILGLCLASAVMALAAAFVPGSSRFGRLLCVVIGLALVAWPAAVYAAADVYPPNAGVAAVPALLVVYAVTTYRRHLIRRTCFPGNARDSRPRSSPSQDRRAAGRRALPGEYGHVPINHAPPVHDPWAALYGAAERERMRGSSARHRAVPGVPSLSPAPGAASAAASAGAATPAATSTPGSPAAPGTASSEHGRQAAFTAMQAYLEQTSQIARTRLFGAGPDRLPPDDPWLSDPHDRPGGH